MVTTGESPEEMINPPHDEPAIECEEAGIDPWARKLGEKKKRKKRRKVSSRPESSTPTSSGLVCEAVPLARQDLGSTSAMVDIIPGGVQHVTGTISEGSVIEEAVVVEIPTSSFYATA